MIDLRNMVGVHYTEDFITLHSEGKCDLPSSSDINQYIVKFSNAVANIGDVRSLAIHPASTTHSQLNEKELAASGVTQSYVRLCIGIEHVDDIIEDLNQALNKSSKSKLRAVS